MDKKTGVIRTLRSLENTKTVEITAIDGGVPHRNATTFLKIQTKPAHLFPNFIRSEKTLEFSVQEDAPQDTVLTIVSASSPKSNPRGLIRYSIVGGDFYGAVNVDPDNGEVRLTGMGLDYETVKHIEIWIAATDSDEPPLSTALCIILQVKDANDNKPIPSKLLYEAFVLEEEVPPVSVITIKATDNDSGVNGDITYRLLDDADGAFTIDTKTGEVFTAMTLDRETVAYYELAVQLSDHGTPSLSSTTTLSINVKDKNDNPPRFTRLYAVNVTENSPPGYFVIKLTSVDRDEGDNSNATYSFADNPGAKFAIDSITGEVTVAGSLDREIQDEYLLKVNNYFYINICDLSLTILMTGLIGSSSGRSMARRNTIDYKHSRRKR